MSGCTSCGWVIEVVAATGDTCLGLLTLVLLFANSSRMVWGKSGSKRTPCCKIGPTKGSWDVRNSVKRQKSHITVVVISKIKLFSSRTAVVVIRYEIWKWHFWNKSSLRSFWNISPAICRGYNLLFQSRKCLHLLKSKVMSSQLYIRRNYWKAS